MAATHLSTIYTALTLLSIQPACLFAQPATSMDDLLQAFGVRHLFTWSPTRVSN